MERWRPGQGLLPRRSLKELDDLRRRLEDFGSFFPTPGWLPLEAGEWIPAIDMYEQDNKYMVKAELPGMKEDEVDVSVVGDRLTIKGKKKAESEVKEENYYRSERSYGSFFRAIDLPPDADPEKVEANYEDGVLEVVIAKTAAAKPRKVTVGEKKRKTSK
jgi:HSP20 family protein